MSFFGGKIMKKQFFGGLALLSLMIVFMVSCTEKGAENGSNFIDPVSEPEMIMVPSVVLYDTAAKWAEDENGNMDYRKDSESGEIVQVFMIPDPADANTLIPEKKEAVRLSDNEKREFYHIMAEGEPFWIQDVFVGVDAVPGIVLQDNAFLYSKPEIAAMYTDARKLPQYFTLAVHTAESNSDFACISAYVFDFNNPVIDKQFIKREMVTTDALDHQVYRLYEIAESNSNETVKREILNDALPMGSKFNYLVVEALDRLSAAVDSNDYGNFTVAPYNEDGSFVAIDNEENGNINVRDKPGTADSETLFSLPSDTSINITAMTNEIESIDGHDYPWYQITVPSMENREGWIFGKYISEDDN
jgi:hypothetical protein